MTKVNAVALLNAKKIRVKIYPSKDFVLLSVIEAAALISDIAAAISHVHAVTTEEKVS